MTATEDTGPDDTIFDMGEAVGSRWHRYLQIHTTSNQITMILVLTEKVAAEDRTGVAQVVLRASYGMNVGTFDMDLDDGEVRFRAGVGLGAADLNDDHIVALLDDMAHVTEAMADGYLPAIDAVLTGADPAEAVASVEG